MKSEFSILITLLVLVSMRSINATPVRCMYVMSSEDSQIISSALDSIILPPYRDSFCSDSSSLYQGLCGDDDKGKTRILLYLKMRRAIVDFSPFIFKALPNSPEEAKLFADANFITRRVEDCWDREGGKTYLQILLTTLDSGALQFYSSSNKSPEDLLLIEDSLIRVCINNLEFNDTHPAQLQQSLFWNFGKLAELGNYSDTHRHMEAMVHNYVKGGHSKAYRVLPKNKTLLQIEIDSYLWSVKDGGYRQGTFRNQAMIKELNAVALERKPNAPELHYIASSIPAETEDERQDRLRSYSHALELGYNDYSIDTHITHLLKDIKNHSEALSTFDSILVHADTLLKPGNSKWTSLQKRRIDLALDAQNYKELIKSYELISKHQDYLHNNFGIIVAYTELHQLKEAYNYIQKEIKNTNKHHNMYLSWNFSEYVTWVTLLCRKENVCREVESLFSSPGYLSPTHTNPDRYTPQDSVSFSNALMNIGHSYIIKGNSDVSFETAVQYYRRGAEIYHRHSDNTREKYINQIENDFHSLRDYGLSVLYDESEIMAAIRK